MKIPHAKALFNPGDLIRRLFLSWLSAACLLYCLLPSDFKSLYTLDGLSQMSFPLLLLLSAVFFTGLCILGQRTNSSAIERWSIFVVFGILSISGLISSFTVSFLICCVVLLVIFLLYAIKGSAAEATPQAAQESPAPGWFILVVLFAAGFALFVSIWTVCRVLTFSSPTYDFGIFSQMFYNMKTTGIPLTTVERDGLLSHFQVHVSPIYYLMLPVYLLFPYPATLQVLQALILASSIIPLWKLCRHHSLPPALSAVVCIALLLYPAYSGGTSYDLHENAFLTPLILWLLYGIDKQSPVLTSLFAILTLCVKEDAAVYVAVIALYLLIRTLAGKGNKGWGLIWGGSLLLLSLIWFASVTDFLRNSGDGVMTYRYQNFMYDGSGSLVSVVKAVLLSPLKAIFECMDIEKTPFLRQMLLPVCALPLLTRRYERYLLLIPFVLINLMSDYRYQHDIFFQYTFGSTACIFYLTAVNLADMRGNWKRVATCVTAFLFSGIIFLSLVIPKASLFPRLYRENRDYYTMVEQTLSQIEDDASVCASTFYTTYLSQRSVLYDVKYASKEHILSCEYAALDVNSKTSYTNFATNDENGFENFAAFLEENGYEVYARMGESLVIYKKIHE